MEVEVRKVYDNKNRGWKFINSKKVAEIISKSGFFWEIGGNDYKPFLYTRLPEEFLKQNYKGCGKGWISFDLEGNLKEMRYANAAFLDGSPEQNVDMMENHKKSYAIKIKDEFRFFGNFSSCEFIFEAGKKTYTICEYQIKFEKGESNGKSS